VTRASLARGLLGSVAEQLMKRSPVPVLLLRAG
jgi:nucleotide-binding universal stress UspA family protein